MALKRARSHSNNVTVIARIQSDLMDLLIKALTFVCVIEARGQTQFLFLKHSGCCPNSGYALIIYFFGAWVLFLKQTNISDVFKIVSRGVDKR